MKRVEVLVFVIMTMLFSSCSYNKMSEKLIPKQESEYGKNVLESIRLNDFITVSKSLNQSIASQVTKEKLEEISKYFPSEKLINTELIGSQVNKINNDWNGTFTFEYQFDNSKWALANIVINKNGNFLSVTGFHVYLTEKSQKEINKFSLYNKTIKHYIILLFTVLIPLFSIFSFIICIRTPLKRRKVLWVIFTLLGVTSTALNWTTGQLSFQLLTVKLLSASVTAASPYSPWFISFSIPIGSIMFWIKKKKIQLMKTESTSINNQENV